MLERFQRQVRTHRPTQVTLAICVAYSLLYWVPGSPSMDYKAQYRPHELLVGYPADTEEPHWIRPETERPAGSM